MIFVLIVIAITLIVDACLLARLGGELRENANHMGALIGKLREHIGSTERLNTAVRELAEVMTPRELVVGETDVREGCCGGACAPAEPILAISGRPVDDPDPAAELAASVPVFEPTAEQLAEAERRRVAAERRAHLIVDQV